MKIKALIISTFVLILSAACVPDGPKYDQAACDDIEEIGAAVEQYGGVDRVRVRQEVQDDLVEMGIEEHCPGYDRSDLQGKDKD